MSKRETHLPIGVHGQLGVCLLRNEHWLWLKQARVAGFRGYFEPQVRVGIS